jgi:hypothetical protein
VSGSTAWPDLHCASRELADAYERRCAEFGRGTPGALALRLRELRWARTPDVQAALDAWRGGGDPYSAAIEFGEHHQLSLASARDAALNVVLARGGFERLPPGEVDAVWHWGMVRSLGGPDLRELFLGEHPRFETALPFLLDDFSERERARLRAPRDPWEMVALGRVAASTRDAALVALYTRAWRAWPPAAEGWLDTFFRGVVVDGLIDVGPLRVDGVPWKDAEISLERDGPGGPARATGSRRSSRPR